MNPIRKILMPLAGAPTAEAALGTALLVGTRFEAHLEVVHVRADNREVAPLAGEGLSGAMVEEMMTAAETEARSRSAAVRALFDRFTTQHQVPVVAPRGTVDEAVPAGAAIADGTTGATASFGVVVGREHELVAQLARLADLTVVSHPATGDEVSSSEALHAVLFDSGSPVMIAPKRTPSAIGRRVALAWNGTAESAASVRNMMPWLAGAEAVCVLHSPDYQRRGPTYDGLLAYLALHDLRPEPIAFAARDRDVGAGLLAAARDWGADLIGMGAYSHSRLRQLILGGVTRHVLEHADLPVVMSR